MKLFGREPAVIFGLIAALIQMLSVAVTHWDPATQGVINAVIVAVAGFLTAWKVSVDAGLAALTGLVQAVIALALAFGIHLSADWQSTIMVLVSAIGAFVVRTQVFAENPASVK